MNDSIAILADIGIYQNWPPEPGESPQVVLLRLEHGESLVGKNIISATVPHHPENCDWCLSLKNRIQATFGQMAVRYNFIVKTRPSPLERLTACADEEDESD